MKLNARQKAFCEYYVACGNATEAAKKAGYSERYTNKNVNKLRQNTAIIEYIEELQKKAQSSRIMSAVERKEWLTDLIKDKKAKDTDRLKALDILNKMDGEYTERVQLSGEVKSNPFSALSVEELKRLAKDDD